MPEDLIATKQKIVSILKLKGPSLPVHISSKTETTILFAGALLSELAEEKIIKISNMKVGGSPLYFLAGQEASLENFHQYLPGKEKEAFLLLRQKKILEDKKQQPAIRVALRNLKDFALPFSSDNEIFWRFHSTTEQEVREMFLSKTTKPKTQMIKTQPAKTQMIKTQPAKTQTVKTQPVKIQQTKIQPAKPAVQKITKRRERPEFAMKIAATLQNNNIEVLEERDVKKKEFSAIIRINSALGPIKFLCIAKDKKKITENDLRLALQKSQALKMPTLVLIAGDINKKALAYAEKWSSLLKLKKI